MNKLRSRKVRLKKRRLKSVGIEIRTHGEAMDRILDQIGTGLGYLIGDKIWLKADIEMMLHIKDSIKIQIVDKIRGR